MTEVALPQLTSTAQAADFLYQTERAIKDAELHLKGLKEIHRRVSVDVLPNLMDRDDLVKFETPSGVGIKKGLLIEGSLPKPGEKDSPEEAQEKLAKRQAALAWATSPEVGWGPFVKDTVVLEFDKGDSEQADKVLDFVRGFNQGQPKVKREQSIHAQTLQSQARKRLEQGLGVPLDDLGLTALTGVKITKRPKEQ